MNSFYKSRWFVCHLIAAIYVAICFGANLSASFWLIDDHAILTNRLAIKNGASFWDVFWNSEVGQWGTALRYRPAYYLMHTAETFLFRDHAFLWYLLRLLFFQQFVAVTLALLSFYVHPLLVATAGLWLFSRPFWIDIFSRLGPGEVYSVFGCVLFGYGLLFILSQKRRSLTTSSLLFLGALLMVGSKELFAPPFLLASLAALVWLKPRRPIEVTFTGLTLLMSAAVMLEILLALSNNPVDILGNQANVGGKLHLLLALIGKNFFLISVVLGLASLWRRRSHLRRPYFRDTEVLFVSAAWGLLVWNFVFYSGNWPTSIRYDFPALLVPWALTIYFLSSFQHQSRFQKQLLPLIAFGMAIGTARNFGNLVRGSSNNVSRTQNSQSLIREISSTSQAFPNIEIVYESTDPALDIEYVTSIQNSLDYFGVNRVLKVRMNYQPSDFEPTSLSRQLFERMAQLPQYKESSSCRAVLFKAKPNTDCPPLDTKILSVSAN